MLFNLKKFKYRIDVYKNSIKIKTHFIKEERYLKPILNVLDKYDLEVYIKDTFNNKWKIKNLLSQL